MIYVAHSILVVYSLFLSKWVIEFIMNRKRT